MWSNIQQKCSTQLSMFGNLIRYMMLYQLTCLLFLMNCFGQLTNIAILLSKFQEERMFAQNCLPLYSWSQESYLSLLCTVSQVLVTPGLEFCQLVLQVSKCLRASQLPFYITCRGIHSLISKCREKFKFMSRGRKTFAVLQGPILQLKDIHCGDCFR